MDSENEKTLFVETIDNANRELLFEQYKLYVESANLTSELRGKANTFFLTANTGFVGLLASLLKFTSQASTPLWIIFASTAGVLLSISWFYIIRSYRSLNSGRFAVINELEEKLPARIYSYEWLLITKKKDNKYIRQSYVEQLIPVIFGLLYILLSVSHFFIR